MAALRADSGIVCVRIGLEIRKKNKSYGLNVTPNIIRPNRSPSNFRPKPSG
jgi:hypothetical protein